MANNSEIVIDPSVLKSRTETYSSLTDINGADVFTDSFQEKVTQQKEKVNQSYTTVQEEVFINSMNNSTDMYEQVKNSMFSSSEIKVIKENSMASSSEIGFAVPLIGIVFVIAILLMIRYVDKRRRKWRKHDTNTYAYE